MLNNKVVSSSTWTTNVAIFTQKYKGARTTFSLWVVQNRSIEKDLSWWSIRARFRNHHLHTSRNRIVFRRTYLNEISVRRTVATRHGVIPRCSLEPCQVRVDHWTSRQRIKRPTIFRDDRERKTGFAALLLCSVCSLMANTRPTRTRISAHGEKYYRGISCRWTGGDRESVVIP